MDENGAETETAPEQVTLNCTVAYLTQCRSWGKCSFSCQTMGASSVRWFHNGCCECIGSTCINFGINESRWASGGPVAARNVARRRTAR